MTDYRELTALPFPIAQIVKGALEAEGIEVQLRRESLSFVYGLEQGMFATRVLVPAERLAEAQALLAEIDAESTEL